MLDDSIHIPALLQKMKGATVTVFGDFCLDAYWDLSDTDAEFSLDTGLPIRRVKSQRYSLGGAGSVLANLTDMGVGCVRAVGVAGTDIFGKELCALIAIRGADTSGFVVDAVWETMVYAKPCFGPQEDRRIDFGAFNSVRSDLLDKLVSNLEAAVKQSDAVILNQQIPTGLSSPIMIERINQVIAAHPHITFLVDARHHPEKYAGATLKLNMSEAARLLNEDPVIATTEASAKHFARLISERSGKPAFLTRGESGLVVAAEGETTLIPGIQVIDQVDTVGAGDAVVAALAAALAAGATPIQAAIMANIAGMITVKKLKTTGTASATEILAAANAVNYVFRPELASSIRHAQYVPNTEIEVIGNLPRNLAIKHCIFDHDGTLSTLREGSEKIMEEMMLRAILGKHHDIVDDQEFEHVRVSVKQLIDRTAGMQTFVQMDELSDLITHFGYVPESAVLDGHDYKHAFYIKLLKKVTERLNRLRTDELQPKDFQIKNVALLLFELHRRGIELYLASGTNQDEAIAEAEAMGYAHYFEGRIYGSTEEFNIDAKRVVLERIIQTHDLPGPELATFSDDPTEIREIRRHGGLCIGVASDELRRFGLNVSKRKRLIQAGADLIVSDYSQLPAILKVLQLDAAPVLEQNQLIEAMR